MDSSHASYNQIEELLFAKSHLDGACEGEEFVSMGTHSFTIAKYNGDALHKCNNNSKLYLRAAQSSFISRPHRPAATMNDKSAYRSLRSVKSGKQCADS